MRQRQMTRLACGLALLVSVGAASYAYADDGKTDKNKDPEKGLNMAATPELDSFVLFGAGLLGAGGLTYLRARVRRRR